MVRETTIAIPRCLNPKCSRDAETMGYCNPCYQGVRRRIRQGKYTEEELLERGKLLRSRSSSLDEFLSK